jgi:uncharacterized protein
MVTRRGLVRGAALSLAATATVGLAEAFAGTTWLWTPPEVTRVRVGIAGLPAAFVGLRIVQLSDLHIGPQVPASVVERAVGVANSLRADVAVVTGDFVHRVLPADLATLTTQIARLTAPLGVFGVLGNHDHWNDATGVRQALRGADVRTLDNSSVRLQRGADSLHLAGIDDYWERKADLDRALADVPKDATVILLAHEPDFADVATRDPRIRLQLSGHTHGGQMLDRDGRAPLLPPFGRRYWIGRYQVGGLTVYTNRGIGVARLPIRTNCPAEVTLFELASV